MSFWNNWRIINLGVTGMPTAVADTIVGATAGATAGAAAGTVAGAFMGTGAAVAAGPLIGSILGETFFHPLSTSVIVAGTVVPVVGATATAAAHVSKVY
jgi:hypothetical protein